jgi:hypothetical protein
LNRINKKELSAKVIEYLERQDEVKSLAGLSVFLQTDKQQLLEQLSKGGKSSDILNFALTYMEKEIVENGLRGKYNATMASFMLKAVFGYKEKRDEQPEAAGDIKIELADELRKYAN